MNKGLTSSLCVDIQYSQKEKCRKNAEYLLSTFSFFGFTHYIALTLVGLFQISCTWKTSKQLLIVKYKKYIYKYIFLHTYLAQNTINVDIYYLCLSEGSKIGQCELNRQTFWPGRVSIQNRIAWELYAFCFKDPIHLSPKHATHKRHTVHMQREKSGGFVRFNLLQSGLCDG